MDDKIVKAVVYLLHRYKVVNLPGLGVFESAPTAASLQPLEGKLQPPSKSLTFTSGSDIDDGLLYQVLQHDMPGYSLAELKAAVADYFARIKEKLSRGEIVMLPDIGRLYNDFEGKITFLQDDGNFNTGAFGLPDVHFYPVMRRKDDFERERQVEQTTPIYAKPKRNFADRLSRWLPLIFGLLVIGVAVYIFFQQKNTSQKQIENTIAQRQSAKEARQAAEQDDADGITAFEPEFDEDSENDGTPTSDGRQADIEESEAATLAPGQSRCIILVGQFSKASGVTITSEKLLNLGYDVYTDKNKGLTRVGAQFLYDEESEVREALRELRTKIEPSAFVFKE